MQITVEVQNNKVAEKILKILDVFKSDGVTVATMDKTKENIKDSEEYDIEYERSFQYKLDRADFVQMKEDL